MPSLEHEAVVRLLTGRPAVLFDLLRDALDVDLLANAPGDALGARSVDDLTIAVASETLRAFAPTELRADLVLVLEGPRGRLAVVVEVQLRTVVDKRRAWPAYVALAHRDLGCPVLLVVLTLDPDVAEWCAQPIELSPWFVLRPLVLGPAQVPRVRDREYAARNLELAVLSAVMHGERAPPDVASDIALAALHALARGTAVEGAVDTAVEGAVDTAVDSERRQDYCDMVLATLGRAARTLMEERMRYRDENDPNPYYSEFARANWDKGRAEGEALGRAQGEALGRAEGERAALLAVLAARGIAVGDDFVARIRACNDLAQLTAWLQRAATATSLGDVLDG